MTTRVGVKAAAQAALWFCGIALPLPALSLGFGELEMQSFLNEPLRAEVELLDTRELSNEDVRIRLAAVDDFDRLGVERSYFLTSIQFEVDVDPRTGRGTVRLLTEEPVLEPYLDLIIEARWPSGRLLREYTVLIDPPAFREEMLTVSASARVAEVDAQQASDVSSSEPASRRDTEEAPTLTASPARDGLALRASTLPAGEMPERSFSATTLDRPEAGNRYMVKRDETLWQIASSGKPEGTTVQQAMLDIQRLNPEAFIAGNINRIKAGYIIYLPAVGEISSDDLIKALDEVREQNQEWRASRGKPGVTAAATLRVSADVAKEPAMPVDSGDRAAVADAGVSAVERPAADPDSESSADAVSVGASATDQVASAKLAAQLDAMTARLDTLEQIVSLKDEQIATLEQALREAREAAATAAVAPQAVPVTTRPTPAADAVVEPPSRSALAGLPWIPIGGGLLLLLLLILLVLRRRAGSAGGDDAGLTASRREEDVFAGVSLKQEALTGPLDDSPILDEGGRGEDAPQEGAANRRRDNSGPARESTDPGGSRGYGERKHDDYIDEGSGGDALAEADIYIAYGRYLQAIELLDSAIKTEPENSAYRVKLIELYVDMGEDDNAAKQMAELRSYEDTDAITRAEALLTSGGAPTDVLSGKHDDFDLESGGIEAASSVASHRDLAEIDDGPAISAPAPTAAGEVGDISLEHDDVDLESPELTLESPETAAIDDSLTSLGSATDDLETFGLADERAPLARQSTADTADAEELEEISFDFEGLEIDEIGEIDSVTAGAGPGVKGIDFDSDDELDLSEALTGDAFDVGADESIVEDLLIADDADQMATKLDLARAYMDMGDSDGARAILEEVAAAGSGEQQEEARQLLSRIA
ncbi:MAG: pilus assembly protein FimV [Halieaceae bacterium]|jgi:pilus assembly protein FimV